MSSDEEEEIAGRSKRSVLNKTGRNRMRTLTDSSDEDEEELFDEQEEDDEEETNGYSTESLRKALVRHSLAFMNEYQSFTFVSLFIFCFIESIDRMHESSTCFCRIETIILGGSGSRDIQATG